jgi:hypothetical protein
MVINMQLVLKDADQNVQHIECNHCHWQGPARELNKGDYFPLGDFTEVFCPACNKYLGFIQHDSNPGEVR